MENKIEVENYKNKLGKILKQRRQALGLTLYEVSKGSGVSTSYMGRIEKGERFPSAEILKKIADQLGYNESEIFTLAGYMSITGEGETRQETGTEKSKLDPYVAKILAQEPVEVQRAVVWVLTMLKSVAGGLKQ
jgi:transcriptional regulator with XRE-family HTH domain